MERRVKENPRLPDGPNRVACARTPVRVTPSSAGITVMSRKNRLPLTDRIARAAEAALAAQHFASAIDILVGIGWLDSRAVKRWRNGQIDCLEDVVQADLPRISEAIR